MKSGGYRSSAAKNKAIIVVAHAILIIVWHVLATGTPTASSAPTTSTAA
jgi:transposase